MNEEDLQKAVYGDEKTQQMLNTPASDPTGVDPKDKEFLSALIALIEDKTIDLYKPETLFNKAVYEAMDSRLQGQADMEAVNLLSAIRDIKGLYDNGFEESFQIQNLVQRVRLTKERIEGEKGDLFII